MISCCGPPGRNRTVIDRLSGGCTSLVLRAEKTAGGEQGIRTPRPMSWATRLAGGHLAPVQDGLSRSVGEAGIEPATSRSRTARAAAALHPERHEPAESKGVEPSDPWDHPLSRRAPGADAGRTLHGWRKERESNPQGSSLIRFRDGCHHPLACPSRAVVVGRVGIEPTSYGLRDRCNASICYRPVAPPLGVEPRPSVFRTDAQTAYARVGKMGYLAIPLVLNYAVVKEANRNIEFRTQESNPDVMVQSHASCHWTSPDQRAAARRAHVSRSSRGAGSQWGPRELNPAGLSGRRVYSAPRLPYRSRAPLLCMAVEPPEKQKSHRVRPGGSFALLRSDRQIYASGALPPGPMPPWKPDGCRSYDQVARLPQSRRALANRAFAASCVSASLFPRRVMMTWFLEDEGIDPRRLTIHYATTTNKSTGNRRRQSRVAS